MNKISIVVISLVVILGIGAIIVFLTPYKYNAPFVSKFFTEETSKNPQLSDTVRKSDNVPPPIKDEKIDSSNSEDPESNKEKEEVEAKEVEIAPRAEEQEEEDSEVKVIREPQEYIVRIYSFTDWQPANLTIYEGDSITFINLDDELHWPGADPHPTHSSLPLFDALGGISENQSYSHTFTVSGTYGHHDHLPDNPPTLGIITVLPLE